MNRRNRSGIVIAAALVLLVGATPLTAGELPGAREVLDAFVNAIGGEKTIKKYTSSEAVGKFEMPAAGVSAEIKVYAMAPNLTTIAVEIPGMGTIREGFDGNVAWSLDPAQGPMIKDGKSAAQAAFGAEYYDELKADDRYESMETVEQTEFNGKDCYKLRLVTSNGDEIFEFYDVSSKLMAGSEFKQATPMGEMPITSIVEEYADFGGLNVPTKMKLVMGPGMEQVITITDVKHNTVDKSVFELPAEIKALAEPAP